MFITIISFILRYINKTNKMKKTKTGLHIDVKGKRIEVYTKKELEKMEEEAQTQLDFIVAVSICALLITIGFIIGLSV